MGYKLATESNYVFPDSLYIHVPFCEFMCHYCDFAKTSRFDATLIKKYFDTTAKHLDLWLEKFADSSCQGIFQSVFLGGGTPSIFTNEWRPIFERIAKHINDETEITIEANPDNISPQALSSWKKIGINRLSIGIQTFSDRGLKTLTRKHSAQEAREAISLASGFFENINLDIIYGWPTQTIGEWNADLSELQEIDAAHLSMYALIFEPSTPMGRASLGGKITSATDSLYSDMYEKSRHQLAQSNYIHEEVSNWSKKNFSCIHNWTYWTGGTYIGLGPGSHSHLTNLNHSKIRFGHTKLTERFLSSKNESVEQLLADPKITTMQSMEKHEQLTDQVICSIRSNRGVDLNKILREFEVKWNPTAIIQKGLAENLCTLDDKIFKLREDEWYRETSWSHAVLQSLGVS